MDDYYVYLLVDEDLEPDVAKRQRDRIFYVGKGRNSRALQHLLEYVQALENGDVGDDVTLGEFYEPPPRQEPLPKDSIRALEHEKIRQMRDIYARGHQVRVDVLRADLSNDRAFQIESAVIDAIGLPHLANEVAGHLHFRAPARAVDQMLRAQEVTVDVPGLQVTISGVWGGASVGGLVGADPQHVWENARQTWSLSPATRGRIEVAAATDAPWVLVAVSRGPTALWGGIILGVWELDGVIRGHDRVSVSKETQEESHGPGWEFVAREPVTARLAALRHKWLETPSRSSDTRQLGPTGIGGVRLSS